MVRWAFFLPISIRLPRSASKRVQMKSAGATPNCRFRSKRNVSRKHWLTSVLMTLPGNACIRACSASTCRGPARLPALPACRAMRTGWPYSSRTVVPHAASLSSNCRPPGPNSTSTWSAAAGDDARIRDWAKRARIDPARVRSGSITLNHDAGRWLSLGLQGDLPAVVRQIGGEWQRQ